MESIGAWTLALEQVADVVKLAAALLQKSTAIQFPSEEVFRKASFAWPNVEQRRD